MQSKIHQPWINEPVAVEFAKGYDNVNTRKKTKAPTNLSHTQKLIAEECDKVKKLLLEKNAAYGNSALDPLRVFARGLDNDAQIRVRIDDKLSRIQRATESDRAKVPEDTVEDLIGYLILWRVEKRMVSVDDKWASSEPPRHKP